MEKVRERNREGERGGGRTKTKAGRREGRENGVFVWFFPPKWMSGYKHCYNSQ